MQKRPTQHDPTAPPTSITLTPTSFNVPATCTRWDIMVSLDFLLLIRLQLAVFFVISPVWSSSSSMDSLYHTVTTASSLNTSPASSATAHRLDMAGRVASATVSGVVGMISSGGGGLSLQGSTMKLQWSVLHLSFFFHPLFWHSGFSIDQLDKADAPAIPESYIYLLAVQCIVSLCEGFASFSGSIYTNIVMQRPRAPGEAVIRAPPALDLSTLPQNDLQTKQLFIVQSIISQAWPALLAALSFIIATNLISWSSSVSSVFLLLFSCSLLIFIIRLHVRTGTTMNNHTNTRVIINASAYYHPR